MKTDGWVFVSAKPNASREPPDTIHERSVREFVEKTEVKVAMVSPKPVASVSIAACFLGSVLIGAAQYPGWLIPPGGRDEKSPLSSVADAVAKGKTLYVSNCARCHGPEGKGSGPPDYAADLTDELRFELNTEGVLFYKIWNGHAIQLRTQVDDMPAFSDKLSKDEVWAVVEYVKSLRAPQRQAVLDSRRLNRHTTPAKPRAAAAAASLLAKNSDGTPVANAPTMGPGCPCCASA